MGDESNEDVDDRARREFHQRRREVMGEIYPEDPPPRKGVQGVGWNFLAGLLLGVLVSVVVWIFGWDSIAQSPHIEYFMWGFPIAKLLGAIGIIFVPRLRGFGIGLLVSVAIGALIFGFKAITTCKVA